MAKHLQLELEKIKNKVLSLGTVVEDRFRLAASILPKRDVVTADYIIKSNQEVYDTKFEIEEDCLKVLALHQPVAGDLRYLIGLFKINIELERISNEVVNIAHCLKDLAENKPCDYIFDYASISEKVRSMLKMSLDAFVQIDSKMAYSVRVLEAEVKAFDRNARKQLNQSVHENPELSDTYVNMFLISRYIDRVADKSINISEEAIFRADGEIVRHHYLA